MSKIRFTPGQIAQMGDLELLDVARGLEIIGAGNMDDELLRETVQARARERGMLDDDGKVVKRPVQPITFDYPGVSDRIPVAEGQTVPLGDILEQMQRDYRLDPKTRYYVDGNPVDMTGDAWRTMQIGAGMRVEGNRPAAEKGR
ncbi:hypothetical protein HYV74_02225 [Candidatus Uhrbacteria bacterium]|nr:hypothetical protein [Candidatus Uhrbacteria bacterium]